MTFGFHWFVAWRYLMARPRRVSPAAIAVTGACFIVSATLSATNLVLSSQSGRGRFLADWAYRNALVLAVVLGALGLLGLFFGMIRYTSRHPLDRAVPGCAVLGWMLLAAGLMMHGAADSVTQGLATAFLSCGGLALGAAIWMYWSRFRIAAAGSLSFALNMLTAAGATAVLATYVLRPSGALAGVYVRDAVALPSLGLLTLGVALSWVCQVRYAVKQHLSRWLMAASLLTLMGSAAFPVLAKLVLGEEGFIQYEPTAGQHLRTLSVTGLALCALAALIIVCTFALRRWVGPIFGAVRQIRMFVFVSGAMIAVLALAVLDVPEFSVMHMVGSRPNYGLILAAVAIFALGELAGVLTVIRYFFTFFTTVSVAGVGIGSMALVIVLSVMSGFESDLREKILGSNAHLLVTKEEGAFTEYREIAAEITTIPEVLGTSPYLLSEVVLAANNNYSSVIIKGVDPKTLAEVTDLAKKTETPRALDKLWPLAPDGAIVGPPIDAGAQTTGDGGAWPPDDQAGQGDAGEGAQGDLDDPPPTDMDVDMDVPEDFSGGELTLPREEPAGDGRNGLDPPPADMQLSAGEPVDFSGVPDEEDGEEGDARDEEAMAALVEGVDDPRDDRLNPDRPDSEEDRKDADGSLAVADIAALEEGDGGLLPTAELPLGFEPETEGVIELDDGDLALSERAPPIPPRVAVLPGVLVGKELVKSLHLYPGQEVRIVSPLAEDTPAGPVPRTRYLRVADIFFTGMYEYDLKFVYVPLSTLQSFLDLEGEVSGIEIRIADPDDTEPVLRKIRELLANRGSYLVQDWKEINRSLFSALKLEKITMFLVLAIIILVASFSIIGNLIMVVVEKAREIALIKTLGANNSGVMSIFIAQGCFIGFVGMIIGVAHGLLACYLTMTYGWPLDPEVYYIDRVPIHVEGMSVLYVAVAGVVISVIATVYPAFIGARLRPIEGLRYET